MYLLSLCGWWTWISYLPVLGACEGGHTYMFVPEGVPLFLFVRNWCIYSIDSEALWRQIYCWMNKRTQDTTFIGEMILLALICLEILYASILTNRGISNDNNNHNNNHNYDNYALLINKNSTFDSKGRGRLWRRQWRPRPSAWSWLVMTEGWHPRIGGRGKECGGGAGQWGRRGAE